MERIERAILLLRGHRVMVDADLAALYGVSIKRLNEQVRRNIKRFPPDFMFQLTAEETKALRSQNATLKGGRGGRSGSASAKQGPAMACGRSQDEGDYGDKWAVGRGVDVGETRKST